MNTKLLALASSFAIATVASAAVTYDENGVGFVGKGDVQSIYDWNNSMLQDNAHLVQFRMLSGGSATWQCVGNNPSGNVVTQDKSVQSESIEAEVGFDARKNRQGQVTGFILQGAAGGSTSFEGVGVCTAPNDRWSNYRLVEGSISYEGGDPILQVSIDGTDWYTLLMSE